MVINTNLAGSSGTPLAKANGGSGSNSKTARASDIPSSTAGATILNSQINQILASAGSDLGDTVAAGASAKLAHTHILQQFPAVMLAQANLSPDTVLSLLQE